MRARQRGVTFIGWIVLLIPVAIVANAGLRITPIYLNYLKVSRALEQLGSETKGDEQISVQAVRNSLDKRLDIDSVTFPRSDQITIVREGKGLVAEARYEDVAPLFGNMSILLKFDKRVPLN